KDNRNDEGNNLESMLLNFIKGKNILLEDYTIKIGKNLTILPTSNNISVIDEYLTDFLVKKSVEKGLALKSMERNLLLKEMLDKVIKPWEFDYVLIDCQPSFSLLSNTALIYAENTLTVLKPEPYSLIDIEYMKRIIKNLNRKYNTDINISGVIINAFEIRKKLAWNISKKIEMEFGTESRVFREKIRFLSHYQNSIFLGNQPVFKMYPGSAAAKSILNLFSEIDSTAVNFINY
ncbi:MAG: ParA family protein, partial [Actinomycetota bacterium]|nr:ParA family protein [Actinomycetota bacterium]